MKRPLASDENLQPSKKGMNPMFSEECLKYLNFRIQQEELSSRLYLSMSLWLNNEGYLGAAALWKVYSEEEMAHADWARNYILSMGIQPFTPKLESPKQVFAGLPEIIEESFDHEVEITKQLKELASEALRKNDHMLYTLTHKYLAEQVEEHDKLQTWIDKLNAFGRDKLALRFLDNEMAKK